MHLSARSLVTPSPARSVGARVASLAAVGALAASLVGPGAVAADDRATGVAGGSPDRSSAGPVSDWTIGAASVGPLRLGDATAAQIDSGVFVRSGPKDPCDTVVRPRPAYRSGFSWGNRDGGRLSYVYVSRRGVETVRGVSAGDTLAEFRDAYPRATKVRKGIDGLRWLSVRTSDTTYLAAQLDKVGKPRPGSTIGALSISRNRPLQPYFSGCSY